jgi:hypothetical protein
VELGILQVFHNALFEEDVRHGLRGG